MRTIHRNVVSALIISKDNKILLGIKDPKIGGVYSGCWHFPGGGIDEGETQEQALRREVLEEVSLNVAPYKPVLLDDKGSGESTRYLPETDETVICIMQFFVYRIDIPELAAAINVRPSADELVQLTWADMSNLEAFRLAPPSIELFKRVGYLQ
jgi:8-oxo-dGTP pyrophosphatase MutT (NUDIX family)